MQFWLSHICIATRAGLNHHLMKAPHYYLTPAKFGRCTKIKESFHTLKFWCSFWTKIILALNSNFKTTILAVYSHCACITTYGFLTRLAALHFIMMSVMFCLVIFLMTHDNFNITIKSLMLFLEILQDTGKFTTGRNTTCCSFVKIVHM